MPVVYQDQDLTHKILGAAIEVHRNLGPGLLESAYRFCLCMEFDSLGISYKQELVVPIMYKNKKCDCGFRVDFLVEDKVILELKSVEQLLPIYEAQLLTYLRLCTKNLGLIINFHVPLLWKGIVRVVNNLEESF